MDTRVNYGGSMDTLHEAKNGIHLLKTTHTEKHVHSFFYSIVFRGRHSWRNRNRRMLEEGSQFHFIASFHVHDLTVMIM